MIGDYGKFTISFSEFSFCNECFALVPDPLLSGHTSWHEKQLENLKKLERDLNPVFEVYREEDGALKIRPKEAKGEPTVRYDEWATAAYQCPECHFFGYKHNVACSKSEPPF